MLERQQIAMRAAMAESGAITPTAQSPQLRSRCWSAGDE
jgi:hypothetical protein